MIIVKTLPQISDIQLNCTMTAIDLPFIAPDAGHIDGNSESGGYLANWSRSLIFKITEVLFSCYITLSYLTGVTAAQLRRHLSNMDVI